MVLIDDDANENYARKLQEKEDKKFAMIMQEQFVENNEDYNNEDMQSNPEVFSKSGGYKQFKEDKGKKKMQGKKVNVGNNFANGQSQHNPNQNLQYSQNSQNSQEVTEYNFGDNRHNDQDEGFTLHQYDESEESKGK